MISFSFLNIFHFIFKITIDRYFECISGDSDLIRLYCYLLFYCHSFYFPEDFVFLVPLFAKFEFNSNGEPLKGSKKHMV